MIQSRHAHTLTQVATPTRSLTMYKVYSRTTLTTLSELLRLVVPAANLLNNVEKVSNHIQSRFH